MCDLDQLRKEIVEAKAKFNKAFRLLSKEVAESSSEVISLRESVNNQAERIVEHGEKIDSQGEKLDEILDFIKPVKEAHDGAVVVSGWITNLAKVVGALTLISGSTYLAYQASSHWLSSVVHWRPH